MALSDTAIRRTKPTERPVRLFDGGGLYLEVAPSGGKWWRFKYRHKDKEKRLSLGTYPEISLKTARERRDAARKIVAEGIGPRQTLLTHSNLRRSSSRERSAIDWLSPRRTCRRSSPSSRLTKAIPPRRPHSSC